MHTLPALAIVGSRRVPLRTDELLDSILNSLAPSTVVITGDAPGVDTLVAALGPPLLSIHRAAGPQPWQLSRRTHALVTALAACGRGASLLAIFATTRSPGTRLACWLAVAGGLPVYAHATPGIALPSLGPGRWLPTRRFAGASRWRPAQSQLFPL